MPGFIHTWHSLLVPEFISAENELYSSQVVLSRGLSAYVVSHIGVRSFFVST